MKTLSSRQTRSARSQATVAATPSTQPQPRSWSSVPRCPACRFRINSEARHLFFAFVEGLGDVGYLGRLIDGGGYCVTHTRNVLGRPDGAQLTDAYRRVLAHRLSTLDRSEPWLPRCPACANADWAVSHAIWLLLRGGRTNPEVTFDAEHPLCLPHLRDALLRADWRAWPMLRGELAQTLERAASEPEVLIGADVEQRSPKPALSTGLTVNWHGGLISYDGLLAALEEDACPACSAVTGASGRFLTWLGSDAASGDSGMAHRLCAGHAWDAAANAPMAASRATDIALAAWTNRLSRLPDAEELPPVAMQARLATLSQTLGRPTLTERTQDHRRRHQSAVRRRLNRAVEHLTPAGWTRDLAAQLLRPDDCAACHATSIMLRRVSALIGQALTDTTARDLYRRSAGVCLRHVDSVLARSPASARELLRERATVRVGLMSWELEEANRKVSWSVRYEPPGDERSAWRRAMALNVGSLAFEQRWLTPDLGEAPQIAT